MQVENQIFYQIAKNRNYCVGDKLHFGKEDNGQVRIFDFSFAHDGQALHNYAFNDAKKGIFKNKERIKSYAIALNEYDFLLRELALEETRKEKFPSAPSRFKCMYLFDDKDKMLEAFNFYKKQPKNQYLVQAIAVKATGEAFYCKDVSLGRSGKSYNEHKQAAIEYWSQDQNSSAETKEVLFVGDVEVIEIIDEIK